MALDNDDPYPFNRKDHPYPEPYEDFTPPKPTPSEKQPDLWESPARPHHYQEKELRTHVLEECAIKCIEQHTKESLTKAIILLQCALEFEYV